ncbi:MAG TPA: hypothetical protein DDW27_11855 [Bacteroidales bacterium]|nr:hypothetical protein [Bacteroidales bacterium]
MKSTLFIITLIFTSSATILSAQDYLISFTASGAASSISSISVENVTQVKSVSLNGEDQLRLWGGATSVEELTDNRREEITFMPNPVKEQSKMRFFLPFAGETIIAVYDLSGKEIHKAKHLLPKGEHTFLISCPSTGIYLVRIRSGNYSVSGSMMCAGSNNKRMTLDYENSSPAEEKVADKKGTKGEVIMQYNTGDILRFTGSSGEYSTVVTLVPVANKTVDFNFIACKDGSGNTYPVVSIGGTKGIQLWMAENLKTVTLNDGTAINNITGASAWSSATGPAWCWYNNTPGEYGLLYNWYAVGTNKLCPAGWRVPSDDEWQEMVQYLGGAMTAGGKLKETGEAHWNNPNSGATNSSGFSAFGGGWRNNTDGSFNDLRMIGYFWTSTLSNITNACYRCLLSTGSIIYGYMSEIDQKYGFSVRCIKVD